MKLFKILLILAICYNFPNLMAQNYQNEWKKIDSLENKGLPESALKETELLLTKIQKDVNNKNQTALFVKVLVYVNKFQAQLEENGLEKAIYRFQTETEKMSEGPSKAIMQSMLAEMYNKYLRNNIYKFSSRTTLAENKSDDISTWDLNSLTQKIFDLYSKSINNLNIKTVKLSDYKDLLSGLYEEALEPTLYDFLINRVIDFYSDENSYLSKPAYRFYIEQTEALSDLQLFTNFRFVTKDSLSEKFRCLLMFQDLLSFHANDASPEALIDADLRRLKWVYEQAIISNKDEMYLKSLKEIALKYEKNNAAAEALYYIAAWHEKQGNNYKPSPEQTYRWDYKKAKELAQDIIKKYPGTYGAKHADALISRVLNRSLDLSVENVYPIDKPILLNLEYRNIKKSNFKLVKITEAQKQELASFYDQDKITNYLNKLVVFKKWSVELIDEGDFQIHSVDIAVPACKNGIWLIMASDKESFTHDRNGISYSIFHVSNLAYFHRQNNGIVEFTISDRNTGVALENVKAEFFMNKYNSTLRKYEERKIHEARSDKNGLIVTDAINKEDYYNFHVKFSREGDELHIKDNYYYNSVNRSSEIETNIVHFFTDRAIYRPGQTVYFKAIVISSVNGKNPKIKADYPTEVIFRDANYQDIAKKSFVTNEFGSFEGSFTAPSSGMTGAMQLYDPRTYSSHSIRVEEYKRPKFEAAFEPLKEAFKLGENVTVKGFGKAYAGNSIDAAKVQYRVVRNVQFPFWRWYWGWNPWERGEQDVAFGETQTNEKGEFAISFNAVPDKSIPAVQKPQFNYTVYADITDVTGETHSAETTVTLGYIALNADINVNEIVNREKTKDIEIITKNLNGEFEAASGTVKIELLETPKTIYSSRFFNKADYFLIPESDFRRDFPNMAYKSEDQYYNWKSVNTVLETNFDSKTDKKIALKDVEKWAQGKYKITLNTADKYGEKIEQVKFFSLYAENEAEVPENEVIFVANFNPKVEPGEKLTIDFGSFDKNAKFLFEIEHDGKIIKSEWLNAGKRIKKELTIEEAYRGGLSFHLTSILNNRFYKKQGNINVPWSNKELEIEYSTFRDKLLPGQQEEWKIKISGTKKDKIAAEVLAGMYDASLDAFAPNDWNLSLYSNNWSRLSWMSNCFEAVNSTLVIANNWNVFKNYDRHSYAVLNWFDMPFETYYWEYKSKRKSAMRERDGILMNAAPVTESTREEERLEEKKEVEFYSAIVMDSSNAETTKVQKETKAAETFGDVKVRTNLNETVFFFPKLMTDENGDVFIKFTMNEALTKWKFLWLAHSKDLKVGTGFKEVLTQKDLMIVPNAPRFFRQNDEIYFTAKVSNMTKDSIEGVAVLQLFDAITMKSIDAEFSNSAASQIFDAPAGQSAPLVWKLKVPDNWNNPVTYRVIAKSSIFSDGEENSLPVLSNRMLLTETMPLPIRGGQKKTFEFKRMSELSKSTTLQHHKYTLEFTPNPAWYAVQALPYIMEYPYDCSEQIFSRFYANSLATTVANSNPKVKKVFDSWKEFQPDALKSNLAKNQELKYALLEETPWILASQSEEQQKKDLAVLFDLNRMSTEMNAARDKLVDRQLSNGGFAWFPGGVDSWYITQYIVEGFGHLDVLGVKSISSDEKVSSMLDKAVDYIDNRLVEYYEELLKLAKKAPEGEKSYLEKDHLDYMSIHYLYTRSFYSAIPVENKTTQKAIEYYESQAKKYWLSKSDYMQGMLALAIHRKGIDKTTPQNIVKSLKERALKSEEMGMYWKYPSGYFWYEMPIETHCLLIEVFNVVAKDAKAVEELKTYLLKAKQTTHWKTTKATASACYALLSTGDNWLMEDQEVKISIGNQRLDQSKITKEAGTGYFKTSWDATQIKNEMATIKVENPNKNVAWGAVYWQYFEELDKVKDFKDTPLKITKNLFKEVRTDRGPELLPINEQTKLLPGDLVKVRIELKVDRDMEYVHMKDMRASGFEPINVLSQYKYQGGLGYYESTRDAATNFFMDYLSKGTYVFEYPLRVNHKGNFSNGVTTIQCMYAPEFTSHLEGVRVKVE